jgi:hypothetical protein
MSAEGKKSRKGDLDLVRTLHFVDFIIFVQRMHNILVNIYLFLTALLHVSMFTHHPQGVFFKYMLKLQIDKV